MSRPVLEIQELRTYFRTTRGLARAVDGINLSIRDGETHALVGESGCGKSVTALSILGLLPWPAALLAGGRVLFHGQDILALRRKDLMEIRGRRISMIFQEPMSALNPVFTIGSQVMETLMRHQGLTRKTAREKAIAMLDRVGIPDPERRLRSYSFEMSGGMQQRVMIAMALCCRPEVLLADEPTTALDVTVQAQILELIKRMQREIGMAVLLITHDLGVVAETAGRVSVMYAGKIVETGPVEAIFERPEHPYTRGLFRSIPSRKQRGTALATIPGTVPEAYRFPEGCRFCTRCGDAAPRCTKDEPALRAVGKDHFAACFALEKKG